MTKMTQDMQNFIKEWNGYLFGDINNGPTGDTAENILLQVINNPQSSDPDAEFFFAYKEDDLSQTYPFSVQELANVCEIELEVLS